MISANQKPPSTSGTRCQATSIVIVLVGVDSQLDCAEEIKYRTVQIIDYSTSGTYLPGKGG